MSAIAKEIEDLKNELIMARAETEGLASQIRDLQNECIELRRELAWTRKDREAWIERFDNLLKLVSDSRLSMLQPNAHGLSNNLSDHHKHVLAAFVANAAVTGEAAVKIKPDGTVEPVELRDNQGRTQAEWEEDRRKPFDDLDRLALKAREAKIESPPAGYPANVRSQGFHAHVEASTEADRRCVHPNCQCAVYGECQRAGGPIPQ